MIHLSADFAPILTPLARRLCNTVANSAAAERAFPQMNLQHTKVLTVLGEGTEDILKSFLQSANFVVLWFPMTPYLLVLAVILIYIGW